MSKKILIIQLRQLGDILLTTPCVRELKRAWGDAEICFLSHPMGKLVLEGNPYLTQHLTYNPNGNLGEDLDLIKVLRASKFDLVLDFMYNPRSALYARLSGAPRRLAFPSRRGFLFNEKVLRPAKDLYIVDEKFSYLSHLGIQAANNRIDLPWHEPHMGPFDRFLASEAEFARAPLRVVLSPTHRREPRQWPIEHYAAIADLLSSEWGAAVIWIWGPGEEEFVRKAQSLAKRPSWIAPKTSFRELAAFIAHCDLFLGNSNGPSHVAVAVDTPSLQLHGPTYASSWCPLSTKHRAIQSRTGDSEGPPSITSIPIKHVWKELNELLPLGKEKADRRRNNGLARSWSPLFLP